MSVEIDELERRIEQLEQTKLAVTDPEAQKAVSEAIAAAMEELERERERSKRLLKESEELLRRSTKQRSP